MRSFICLTWLSLFSFTQLVASSLSWDRTEVDLEMKPEQKEVRTSFNVTNNGDKRIRIARVKTSCGCTGSIIDRKILQPGESTEIIGTFNKGKRQGLNRISMDVFIDSQPEPVATLRMNIEVPRLIDALPQIVYWTSSSSKSERRVSITLDKRYVDTIRSIKYDDKKLDVIKEVDPNRTAVVILKITPKRFDELYRGTIEIKASGKDGREAEAKIMTLVQP